MAQPNMAERRQRLVAAAPASARFGFQGLRAADSIAVEECLPLDFLVACDWGLDGPGWDARLRYFSVEREKLRRIVWTHASLVEAYAGPLGAELRGYLVADDAPRLIVPYRSTEFLETLSQESGGRVSILASPLRLKNRLDDKIAFRQEAERRGVAVPPGRVLEVGALDEGLLRQWGPRVIVTERIGSSGNQTHMVESPRELAALREGLSEKLGGDARVIATHCLEGPAVGATAFTYRGEAWMSHPSVMVTGLAGCATHPFDYSGSDYGAYCRLPRTVQSRIESATLTIGEWAAGLGYGGIFGVDFVLHGGEPYALEVNPRLLGTTQLLTELERREGSAPPSTYWHLAEFLGAATGAEEASAQIALLRPPRLSGFQLLPRNTRPRPVRVGRSTKPGVYEIIGDAPQFIREGDRISALEGPDEILLTCSPPEGGTVVEPRGVFFKLEGVGTIYDAGVKRVTPQAVRMVEAFTQRLELSESR